MLVEQRQAFMLTEHFIRCEKNLKQLTLYGCYVGQVHALNSEHAMGLLQTNNTGICLPY